MPEALEAVMHAHNDAMTVIEGKLNFTSNDSTVEITEADGNTDLSSTGGDGGLLPAGEIGDMLYHDGETWITLPAPTGMTIDPVMRFNLSTSVPYWEEPEDC